MTMAYCFPWLPLNIQFLYDVAGSADWTVMAVPGDGCIHVLSTFIGFYSNHVRTCSNVLIPLRISQ